MHANGTGKLNRVLVRTLSSTVVFACIVATAWYIFRINIIRTYFPGGSNSRDMMRITLLLSISAYFCFVIYRGKIVWFLDSKFGLKKLLATVFVVALFSASIAPVARMFLGMESARKRVRNDLDHIAIRDSGRQLLSAGDATNGKTYDADQFPLAIAMSYPTSLRIRDGILIIGYGGGLGQFGLLVVPDGRVVPYSDPVAEGVVYFDLE